MIDSFVVYVAIGFAIGIAVGVAAFVQGADVISVFATPFAMSIIWLPAAILLIAATIMDWRESRILDIWIKRSGPNK